MVARSNVILLFSLIIIFLVSFFVIRPTARSLKPLNIEVAARTKEVKDTRAKIEALKELEIQINQARRDFEILSVALPSEAQVPEILVMIQTLADRSGLGLVSIQPVSTQIETASPGTVLPGKTSMNVSLAGGYGPFISFFDNLVKNIRPIQISRLTMNGGTAQDPTIRATLTLDFLTQTKIAPTSTQTTTPSTTEQTQGGTR